VKSLAHSQTNESGEAEGKLDYKILFPKENPIKDGNYDVWFQFHENERFMREWVKVMRSTVLVTLHIPGKSGVYEKEFQSPSQWKMTRDMISDFVARQYGQKTASPKRIGLSGFSAGCGPLERIGSYGISGIDSMICLDGFHGTYKDAQHQSITDKSKFKWATNLPTPIPDFLRIAADGNKFLGITHSSVPNSCQPAKDDKPETCYSSTTAIASKMIWWVGGEEPAHIPDSSDAPYSAYRTYDQGSLHVIGGKGGDGPAHSCQFQFLSELLEEVKKERGFR
jgi:hypothetical protein